MPGGSRNSRKCTEPEVGYDWMPLQQMDEASFDGPFEGASCPSLRLADCGFPICSPSPECSGLLEENIGLQ